MQGLFNGTKLEQIRAPSCGHNWPRKWSPCTNWTWRLLVLTLVMRFDRECLCSKWSYCCQHSNAEESARFRSDTFEWWHFEIFKHA